MALSRRIFNKNSALLLLSSSISPLLIKEVRQNFGKEEVRVEKVKNLNFINKIDTSLPAETELLVPSYLGNAQRRFYGRGIPQGLNLINKFNLGSGKTNVFGSIQVWTGAGWTGQPTIIKDQQKLYLIIGAYDHHLRKIDLATNQEVWRYKFDDVIKGSSTVYIQPGASEPNRVVVLQGSRLGFNNSPQSNQPVPSFRAISFRTGQELWRLNIRKTDSYSRDNDSSALDLGNGLIFNVGENAIGYFLNSYTGAAKSKENMLQPEVLAEVQLYQLEDVPKHRSNLVAESSPARLNDKIFVAAGSGHFYGIGIANRKIVWDFYVGSDLDGTIAISKDEKLFCAVEKQYIPGNGGVLKLDPSKPPVEAVEWFLPTSNIGFANWKGGIVGSVALNDEYRSEELPALFATNAVDGNLYIGSQTMITGAKVKGPLLQKAYDTPLVVFKQRVGPSISTPIFTDGNRLVTAGYDGIYLFQLYFDPAQPDEPNMLLNDRGDPWRLVVEQVGRFMPGGSFESTPVVWDGLIRICSKDGFMYTLG